MTRRFGRRNVLRGMIGGGAVTVGLPFLDCFLNGNGTALASGAPLPTCFGTWYQGLGFNPGQWEPKIAGANYQMGPALQALVPFRDRINIYSGMKAFLDGRPMLTHVTGQQIGSNGGIPREADTMPSIDSLIADVIGTRTRFRSLEVSCDGTPQSNSRRSGNAINPSETSPLQLYTRVFGPEFKDPNAADFVPDPRVMVRRSILSGVTDQRDTFVKQLGTADRVRLDEYFTSLRELEKQLDLQLQKPAPLEACTMPEKPTDSPPGTVIDDALNNGKLFGAILAHALACGQTRVINISFSGGPSGLRKAGSAMTFHMFTHEEAIDPKLGYQPETAWFMSKVVDGFATLLKTLDGVREGDGTLLDRTLLYYSTDHGYARLHTLDNMPILTAGRAGGRMKTGIHVPAPGDPITRVGLTMMQALGVPVNSWGTESNNTSKTITEVMG